ncbi:MAG: undecaprenyldiphospho-muramoylpentapeptide beta-N-acetylglucosaminyltransferase [Clostridiales bacterium]|nr:undecaprenyldiphospho-muramoylpentapeptide beta-N-acetylglucosaminyltransferase [Candidatus Crickella merdequi]
MRIVLTGGCTGGHIYPALAIGDKFREMQPDAEIIYIAHPYGLETSIVPKAGYDLKLVTAEWFDRSNPVRLAKTILHTARGRREAYRIMKDFKPDVVVSTGSFVSVPVVLAGAKYGADIYIQEQNAFPGLSNKLLSKYAKKIFLGFEAGRDQFKEKDKLVYSGNPVRSEFGGRDRAEDRRTLGIPEDDLVIMAFGGSLGSPCINEMGEEIIKRFGGRKGVTFIFGTGRGYYDTTMAKLKEAGLADYDNVKMSAYIDGMPRTLSASDIVISRSGALSVAEVTMSGRAAIFVPSPNVTADHQYFNAKAVADNGGAYIVRESDTSCAEVMEKLEELIENRDKLAEMGAASFALAPAKATEIIYNEIMESYGR